MAAPPAIPPRPSRAQQSPASASHMDVPKIPPRPKRSVDRSVSPNRDTFARSPLNNPAFLHNGQQHKESHLSAEMPPRPPSVTLPSLGQEGSEYASFEDLSKTLTNEGLGSPQQTKNVAGDLPLYQPKASVPVSTAKNRIQTVTRTDSNQAAAAGFGKLGPDDKLTQEPESGRSGSSAGGNTRPSSMYKDEEEHGIPEIGLQVPMYPNAGDVQAPTPSPYDQQQPSTGVGFFNKASSGRHHGRTKSGREVFTGPPGSYGRHGHGKISNDEFEQSWYAKHPEEHRREKAGEYGPHIKDNRKDYHWEGDKLAKLVHAGGAHGTAMGTSRETIGTPDEHVGYMASDEYASRMASPRPQSGRPASISSKSGNVESPLRQMNFPADQLARQNPPESEADEDVIHIDPPSHRSSKVNQGGYEAPTEDLGPEGGNTDELGGWVSERGYGVPILASDEIEKHPAAEFRQPAVSPELERRGSGEYTVNEDGTPAYITKQRTHSRSSSRNNSIPSAAQVQRFISSPSQHDRSGTPLGPTKEYEPLFPEDEEAPKKPKTAADKLRRPDLARHHFPSQDVWEDTPSSLQLETTVETPQAPEEPQTPGDVGAAKVFEKPETEEARKENITKEDQQSFLPEHTKRFANKHLQKEHLDTARPGMQQRFPSQDIWEDAPDHGHLETTVSGPQTEDTSEYMEDSPVVDKPTVPIRPAVPARAQKAKETSPTEKKGPVLPDKPKPQVPARPSKPLTKSSENIPTLESQTGAETASQPKTKPTVPARPGGSKIAALQAGFLKDLNSKLGLGPQAPKVQEPEPEKEEEPAKPLQDARKGRAKGPQRRKPASSPSPATATVTAEVAVPKAKLEFAPVTTIWSIDNGGEVNVPAATVATKLQETLELPEKPQEPDIAGEVVKEAEQSAPADAELTRIASKASEGYSDDNQLSAVVTKESSKEVEAEPLSAGALKGEAEGEVDAAGGLPLEKGSSVDEPAKVDVTEEADSVNEVVKQELAENEGAEAAVKDQTA